MKALGNIEIPYFKQEVQTMIIFGVILLIIGGIIALFANSFIGKLLSFLSFGGAHTTLYVGIAIAVIGLILIIAKIIKNNKA